MQQHEVSLMAESTSVNRPKSGVSSETRICDGGILVSLSITV
jgi:hypothetical protein